VTLNWSVVSDVSFYTIHYNKVGQTVYTQVATSGYVLTGLTARTQYEFRITATDSTGTSLKSNAAT